MLPYRLLSVSSDTGMLVKGFGIPIPIPHLLSATGGFMGDRNGFQRTAGMLHTKLHGCHISIDNAVWTCMSHLTLLGHMAAAELLAAKTGEGSDTTHPICPDDNPRCAHRAIPSTGVLVWHRPWLAPLSLRLVYHVSLPLSAETKDSHLRGPA